jgi:hypothetical protein
MLAPAYISRESVLRPVTETDEQGEGYASAAEP